MIVLARADARHLPLKDGCVQCVVTSPPFWGLRQYETGSAKHLELGSERTPEEYVAHMVEAFREVKRVLRDDGTLWLEIGDCYATGAGKVGNCPGGGAQGEAWAERGAMTQPNRMKLDGYKPKDLVGIPWQLAFALRADGWYLRQEIVWHKPNPMPESVQDRPTRAHSTVFLLAKAQRYYYDAEAVKEPLANCNAQRTTAKYDTSERGPRDGGNGGLDGLAARMRSGEHAGRNLRSVWQINTQPTGACFDFSSADYVDHRGIPRRWSPGCPVHEQDGRLRREVLVVVSCGGQGCDSPNRNEYTDDGHEQALTLELSATAGCNRKTVEGTRLAPSQGNSGGNSTPVALPCEVEAETPSRRQDTRTQPAPSTTGSEPRASCGSAIESNNGSCRSSHEPGASPPDSACVADESHTPSTQLALFGSGALPNSDESNRAEASSASVRGSGTGETSCYSSDKHDPASAYLQAKCSCEISQVSHYATFPPKLVEPCIKAGTSAKGACPKCGAPWERVTEKPRNPDGIMGKGNARHANDFNPFAKGVHVDPPIITTTGWQPTCSCECADIRPCVVLDPFCGTATVARVAIRLKRSAVGFDLSDTYLRDHAMKRTSNVQIELLA